MSRLINQSYEDWKNVERYVRRQPWHWGNEELTGTMYSTWCDGFLLFLMLWYDLSLLVFDVDEADESRMTIYEYIDIVNHYSVDAFIDVLSDADDRLLSLIENGIDEDMLRGFDIPPVERFKHVLLEGASSSDPSNWVAVLKPLMPEITTLVVELGYQQICRLRGYTSSPSELFSAWKKIEKIAYLKYTLGYTNDAYDSFYDFVDAFARTHQALVFLSRLSFERIPDGLRDRAIDTFLETDLSLDIDWSMLDVTSEKSAIERWFNLHPFVAPRLDQLKHGPGAVSYTSLPGSSLSSKYRSIERDARTDYLDKRLFGEVVDLPWGRPATLNRTNRLICVPKSATKCRTICAEPVTLQWYQQGYGASLRRWFDNHPVLKHRVALGNQEINVDWARFGSDSGLLATVDLTAASDTVSWELVRRLFRSTPLYLPLLACRSNKTELPTGEVIPLKKYSTMGSSLTFPLECMIFTAICEGVIRDCHRNPDEILFRVYGDDIIIEREFVQPLLDRLVCLGFKPNVRKTFFRDKLGISFRESCGGEFLNGYDVTPVKISRRFRGFSIVTQKRVNGEVKRIFSVPRVSTMIETANRLSTVSPSARRFLLKEIFNRLPRKCWPPFSSSGEGSLRSRTPTNWNHLVKDRADYQDTWLVCGGSRPLPNREDRDDDVALYEWHRRNLHRERLLYPEDSDIVDTRLTKTMWSTATKPFWSLPDA